MSIKQDKRDEPSRDYQKENKPKNTRKIPVRYVEVVEEPVPIPRKGHTQRGSETYRRSDEYTVEELDSMSARPQGRQPSFDEQTTSARGGQNWAARRSDLSSVGSRSPEARRRRRRERVVPEVQPWEDSRGVEDEVIVVTEHEYRRPREESSRRTQEYVDRTQEYVDRSTLDARQESRRFAPDDAARYFTEDWETFEKMPSPPSTLR